MNKLILSIKFSIYTICINYFLTKKKFNTVRYILNKKFKTVSKMRSNFRIVNSRDVRTVGYDTERKSCIISYNHKKSGRTIYYHNVTQEQFDIVNSSNDVATEADNIFKDNTKTSF